MRLTVSGGRRRIGMLRLSTVFHHRTIPPRRMSVRNRLGGALLALMLATPAAAQVQIAPAQPIPGDPDAVLVEELVVTARLPGPAWWRVSDADTTVYDRKSTRLNSSH